MINVSDKSRKICLYQKYAGSSSLISNFHSWFFSLKQKTLYLPSLPFFAPKYKGLRMPAGVNDADWTGRLGKKYISALKIKYAEFHVIFPTLLTVPLNKMYVIFGTKAPNFVRQAISVTSAYSLKLKIWNSISSTSRCQISELKFSKLVWRIPNLCNFRQMHFSKKKVSHPALVNLLLKSTPEANPKKNFLR